MKIKSELLTTQSKLTNLQTPRPLSKESAVLLQKKCAALFLHFNNITPAYVDNYLTIEPVDTPHNPIATPINQPLTELLDIDDAISGISTTHSSREKLAQFDTLSDFRCFTFELRKFLPGIKFNLKTFNLLTFSLIHYGCYSADLN